jgi:hypothetical protein
MPDRPAASGLRRDDPLRVAGRLRRGLGRLRHGVRLGVLSF